MDSYGNFHSWNLSGMQTKRGRISENTASALPRSKVRRSIKKQKSVKITINIDAESLAALKKEASASGAPYQRLLNRILKESLANKKSTESRIERIERELREVKRRLAA